MIVQDDSLITIRLLGRFAVVAPDGTDISPKSAKAQGLIALLAASADKTRSRPWLQDHLWSDRGRDQGAASLRQALSEVRRALGLYGAVMTADRRSVALHATQVAVDTDAPDGVPGAEFLEGLDVRDPEFEDWLRLERMRFAGRTGSAPARADAAGPAAAVARRRLVVQVQRDDAGLEGLFAGMVLDCLTRSLQEQMSVDIVPKDTHRAAVDAIVLSARGFFAGKRAGVRLGVEGGAVGRALWSGTRIVPMTGAPPVEHDDIQRLVNEALDGLSEALLAEARFSRSQMDAGMMGRLAVRRIFSMQPLLLAEAETLLTSADQCDPRGIYLAWRAMLRVTRLVERHDGSDAGIADEAHDLAMRAVAIEPLNSMVLAVAANTMLLIRGDAHAGLEYASRATRANPANPFAWDALSTAAMAAGAVEDAHRHTAKVQRLAANSPFKHWFDMGRCLSATRTGRLDEAIRLAETSAAVAPDFRPPLRYLTALYALNGDEGRATRALRRLEALEPDFSFDRMARDPDYPVAALRDSKLLGAGIAARIG